MRFTLPILAALVLTSVFACSSNSTTGVSPGPGGSSGATSTTSGAGGAACGDTQSDAANCGSCGHACGGALICVEGSCQPALSTPTALAQNIAVPVQLALDANNVYAGLSLDGSPDPSFDCSSMGEVIAVSRTTMAQRNIGYCHTLASSGNNYVVSLAVNSSSAVWNDTRDAQNAGPSATVESPLDGSQSTTLAVNGAVRAAVDETYYYYGVDAFGGLRRAKLDGTEDVGLLNDPSVVAIAVDATTVYYGTTPTCPEDCEEDATIASVSKHGGTATTLATGLTTTRGVVASGEYVYWLDAKDEQAVIRRVAKTGGPTVNVVEGVGQGYTIQAFAVDAANVYWLRLEGTSNVLEYNYSVWKQPLAGGERVELAAGAGWVQAIVVDDTAVIWSQNDHANGRPHFGSIWMLPKQ